MSRDISKLKLPPYSSVSSVLCYQGAVAVLTYLPARPIREKACLTPYLCLWANRSKTPSDSPRFEPTAQLPGLPEPQHIFSPPSPPAAAREPGGTQLNCKHAVTLGPGAKGDF